MMLHRPAIFLALLLALCAPARAATTLDYSTSDGSFCMTSTLRATSCGKLMVYYLDLTNSKMWTWDSKLQQFNAAAIGSQDPTTNTGGKSISGIAAGPYFPMWSGFRSSAFNGPEIGIGNFGGTALPTAIPTSGFSTWNAATSGTVTWNPSDKNASLTLSNGDLTVSKTSSDGSYGSVRATASISSGKAYFATLVAGSSTTCGAGFETMIGFGNSTASLSNYVGQNTNGIGSYTNTSTPTYWLNGNTGTTASGGVTCYNRSMKATAAIPAGKRCVTFTLNANTTVANTWGAVGIVNGTFSVYDKYVGQDTNSFGQIQETGTIFTNGATVGVGGVTPVTGDIQMLCINSAVGKAWWRQQTTGLWNGATTATQNPDGNVGGVDISGLGATIYIAFSFQDVATRNDYTFNFGATAMTGLPTGYCTHDDAVCGVAPFPRGYIFGAHDNERFWNGPVGRCELEAA